ncbi:hypothetical protein LTR37_002509 [Vermiconidia calcicola]|uniref:Uncharacterized protein n=1 Tax=Vermiconidia calcicola TaxID=1690605 RepID=A0ACC3NT81_9PEZI|nr:hypothetical protein LTR37_002509 [Vermiconidia calcicola]
MKLTTTALLALTAAFASADPSLETRANQDMKHCMEKAPNVHKAIEKFCKKTDMVVPSNYAHMGETVGNTFIQIMGPCDPPQWVPQQACWSQFHHICRHGNSRGEGTKQYGRQGCQEWVIG